MEKYIEYKGFKIEQCQAGYTVWGESPFYPIDTRYITTKSLRQCKVYINDWLKTAKVKKWKTLFHDRITKDVIKWPLG